MQQHIDMIDIMLQFLRRMFSRRMTLVMLSIIFAIYIINLLPSSQPDSFPDLFELTHLARSFKPLIYYSEGALQKLAQIQDTSTALWDLAESMRVANVALSPIISRELDDLSKKLKLLGAEQSTFLAAADGDIDNVLMVMEWAGRELQGLQTQSGRSFEIRWGRIHIVLVMFGLLGDPSKPMGANLICLDKRFSVLTANTPVQRTRKTLEHISTELLRNFENSINHTLQGTTRLLAILNNFETSFTNIARLTAREHDAQTREEEELLGSFWVRVMGGISGQNIQLEKFNKAKKLLEAIQKKIKEKKNLFEQHAGQLRILKSHLEVFRKRLVGYVVRRGVEQSGIGLKPE